MTNIGYTQYNSLGDGTTIIGKEVWEFDIELSGQQEQNDYLYVHVPEEYLVVDNKLLLHFHCHLFGLDMCKSILCRYEDIRFY